MAQITIDIPAGVTPRVIDAIAARYGYQATVNGVANPETKGAFAKRMVVKWVKDIVREHEAALAQTSAFTTAAEKAESEINIT